MPELPEVEAVCRALRPLIVGRRIAGCRVVHPIAVRPHRPAEFARAIVGQSTRSVERRAKYLLLELETGWLVIHFMLDGQLFLLPSGRARSGPHCCLRLDLSGSSPIALGYVDPRHFGRVRFAPTLERMPGMRRLGLEPLSPAFTPRALARLLRASRRPLKLLLMDQTRIAGLGNIYSNEALWRARLSPRRPSNRVPADGVRALHKAIVGVLRAALRCCLVPPPDFRDPHWWFQGLDRILRVYGREGRPCRRCGPRAPRGIRRIEQSGRSSFFCPRCQK
jgi:formamidopyrimidine-DNA glycosylase